jgi:ABC-2 type transport system ATP-binding protein
VQTRTAIISYLLELNKNGTTLIYTSHQLNEAEDLCEQIAMIDEGKIITQGHIDEVLKAHDHQSLEELFINLTGKAYRN